MSCHWDIKCVTCGETLGMYDTNHRLDLMKILILCKDGLAGLTPLLQLRGDRSVQIYEYWVDPKFFAEHKNHELIPINEYGQTEEEYKK